MNNGSAAIPLQGLSEREAATRLKVDGPMRSRKLTDAPSARAPIERAYLERGLVAAMDLLTYVSRAITPSHSFRRFNTRFFLSDGNNVFGEPMASEELEDVGWHPIGREALASFRDVTRFMLARARCARGPRAARHRSFIEPRTPAASAFAARRSIRTGRPQRASAPSTLAPNRLPGSHQGCRTTADFRLGAFRSLSAATRRAAANAARAHVTSSAGSSKAARSWSSTRK